MLVQGNLEYPATLWVCLHEEFPNVEALAQSSTLVSKEDAVRLQQIYALPQPPESQLDAESITKSFKANLNDLEFAWELLKGEGNWPPERWVAAIAVLPQWAKDQFFKLLDPEVYPVTLRQDLMRMFGTKEALDEALRGVSPDVAETIQALLSTQPDSESGKLDAETILKILKINWNVPEYTLFLLQKLGWDTPRKTAAMHHLPEWAVARIRAIRPPQPLSQVETA